MKLYKGDVRVMWFGGGFRGLGFRDPIRVLGFGA